MLRLLVLLGAASALLACAGPAPAHEGGTHIGFASRVSVIDPFLPGLLVQVVGGHEKLSVANLTKKNVVILDDGGEPFVRVAAGRTEVWTEPRVGANDEPPDEEGLVRNWRIRATADGEPFEIVGFLGYRPPPGNEDDGSSGFPTLAILLGGGLLVLAVLATVGHRRRVS